MCNNKLNTAVLVVFLFTVFGCTSKKINELPARQSEEWIKKATIYEVNLRSFSQKKAFISLESHLPELKKLGITVVSLMPIHPIGELNRKGRFGSSFAVKDHFSVNPELGSVEDFKSLIKTAHQLGFKIIINFAAKYTAWDSQILMEHPEWFVHNEEGAIVSPDADLYDVAQLDYNQHEPKKYMISAMKFWVNVMDVDGFKCSASDVIPLDFWEIARKELEKIKPIMMISESAAPENHLEAFNAGCSWNIDVLVSEIINSNKSLSNIEDSLQKEKQKYPLGSLHLRSINQNNLDYIQENQIESVLRKNEIAAVLQFTLPGIPLIYSGGEIEINKQFDLSAEKETYLTNSSEFKVLYKRLSQLRCESHALQMGKFYSIKNSENDKVFSFVRISDIDTVIVAVNFAQTKMEPKIILSPGFSPVWKDKYSNSVYKVKDSTLMISLEPLCYSVLTPITGSVMK